jgi:hypothetical protein
VGGSLAVYFDQHANCRKFYNCLKPAFIVYCVFRATSNLTAANFTTHLVFFSIAGPAMFSTTGGPYDDATADTEPYGDRAFAMARVVFTIPTVGDIPPKEGRAEKQRIIRRKSKHYSRAELDEAVKNYGINTYRTYRDVRKATSEGSKLAMECIQYEVEVLRLFPKLSFAKRGAQTDAAKYLAKMQAHVLEAFGSLPVLNWFVLSDGESAGEYEGLAPQGLSAIPVLAHFLGPYTIAPARAVVCHLLDPHETRPYARLPTAHTAVQVAAARPFSETTMATGVKLFNRRVYQRLVAQVVLESQGKQAARPGLAEVVAEAKSGAVESIVVVGQPCLSAGATFALFLEDTVRSLLELKHDASTALSRDVLVQMEVPNPVIPDRFDIVNDGKCFMVLLVKQVGEPFSTPAALMAPGVE